MIHATRHTCFSEFLKLTGQFLIAFLLCTQVLAEDFSQRFPYRPSPMQPENLAVVINTDDPNSVEVGNYYIQAHQVPTKNLVKVSLGNISHQIGLDHFNEIKAKIDAQLNPNIQAILLVWIKPFAVGCNSITSVMTLGFDASACAETTCPTSRASPYFNSASLSPMQHHQIRPTMLLPTDSAAIAKAVIDRGVLSNFSMPEGTGYFLKTSDIGRSKPREHFFPKDFSLVKNRKLRFRTLKQEYLRDKHDVMFYFTGQERVKFLDTLNFMPGAVADHLTSAGGILDTPIQMRASEWLEAGATGSYGSVSEPCNYAEKFPNPIVFLGHYLAGETLIESYWKSVKWPAQGLFIGDPLAAPYRKLPLSNYDDAAKAKNASVETPKSE